MMPLAVMRLGTPNGRWCVVVSDGGAILFRTHSWSRAVEVSRLIVDALTWDHEIDGRGEPC